jgi:putative ABC transport system permease protein
LGRQREMAVRMALGASQASVARLFLLQSAVLAGAGAVGGLLFAEWARQVMIVAAGDFFHVAPELSVDAHTLLFLGVVVFLVAATLGLFPAWQATRFGGPDVRTAGGRGIVGASTRKQRILLAFQVALTLALVAGSGMFTASARHLYTMNLGLRSSGVAEAMLAPLAGGYASLPAGPYYRDMLQQAESLPGVSSAGLADFAPSGRGCIPTRSRV